MAAMASVILQDYRKAVSLSTVTAAVLRGNLRTASCQIGHCHLVYLRMVLKILTVIPTAMPMMALWTGFSKTDLKEAVQRFLLLS